MEVRESQSSEKEVSNEIDEEIEGSENGGKPDQMLLLKLLSEWKGRYKILNVILKIIFNVILFAMILVLVIGVATIAFVSSAILKAELLGDIVIAVIFLMLVLFVTFTGFIGMVNSFLTEISFLKYVKSKKITVSQIFAEDEGYLEDNAYILSSNKNVAKGIKFAQMVDYYDRNKKKLIIRIIVKIIILLEYFLFASAVLIFLNVFKMLVDALPFELNGMILPVILFVVMFIHMIIINSIIKIMNKSAQKKRTEWYKANDVRMYNFIEKFNIDNINDLRKDPRDF